MGVNAGVAGAWPEEPLEGAFCGALEDCEVTAVGDDVAAPGGSDAAAPWVNRSIPGAPCPLSAVLPARRGRGQHRDQVRCVRGR